MFSLELETEDVYRRRMGKKMGNVKLEFWRPNGEKEEEIEGGKKKQRMHAVGLEKKLNVNSNES